jgi:hypothetical protein
MLDQMDRYVTVLEQRTTLNPDVHLLVCRDKQTGCTRLITAGLQSEPLKPKDATRTELVLSFHGAEPGWAMDALSKAAGRPLAARSGDPCPFAGWLPQRPSSLPSHFTHLYGPSGAVRLMALTMCHANELAIEAEPVQILNHLYHHGVDDIMRLEPRPDLGAQTLAFSHRCLIEARGRLVAGDPRGAMGGLARAGHYLEEAGQPDKAMSIYAIAQARGANAMPALHRLHAGGVSRHPEFEQRVDFFLNHGSTDLWYFPEAPRRRRTDRL